MDERELLKLLMKLKQKFPEIYRHLAGLIRSLVM